MVGGNIFDNTPIYRMHGGAGEEDIVPLGEIPAKNSCKVIIMTNIQKRSEMGRALG